MTIKVKVYVWLRLENEFAPIDIVIYSASTSCFSIWFKE